MRAVFELAAALTVINLAYAVPLTPRVGGDDKNSHHTHWEHPTPETDYYISFGPRPYFILQNMTEGPLKSKLESCQNGPFEVTGWSIGHRGGGTLQIPEETVQSTMAGARMGAGVLECDVSFTADRGLVCRHDLCDLHTTTDILVRPELAAKCSKPFTPANDTASASALCCTADITLDEFTSLCGKMDGFNKSVSSLAPAASPEHLKSVVFSMGCLSETLEHELTVIYRLPLLRISSRAVSLPGELSSTTLVVLS
jgi:glycerophosphoryl diester phosphodiesterase